MAEDKSCSAAISAKKARLGTEPLAGSAAEESAASVAAGALLTAEPPTPQAQPSGMAGASAESARAASVRSFKVMDILCEARAIEARADGGLRVIHLEMGEPSGGAPQAALAAARAALDGPSTALGYTPTRGIPALRRALEAHYAECYSGCVVPWERIHVTTGSSAGLVLACSAAFDIGDAVGVARTTYPCYRNTLAALGCETVPLVGGLHPFSDGAAELRATAAARAEAGQVPAFFCFKKEEGKK
jgi:DNA-binding transcriptional MocR family regulator